MRMTKTKLVPLSVLALAFVAVGAETTAAADPLPYGPDTCLQGFVWREAGPGDAVCVTPDVRSSTAAQNGAAAQNVQPGGGAYGPNTCKSGFVWREAFPGDSVCVTPAVRSQAAGDNAAAASRKAANAPAPAAPAAPAEKIPCFQNPAPGFIPGNLGPFC